MMQSEESLRVLIRDRLASAPLRCVPGRALPSGAGRARPRAAPCGPVYSKLTLVS
jgi:hypothetical protein